MGYELGWLTPAGFEEARALVQRIKALMDDGKKKREGRLYLTMAVVCPVVRKRGARSDRAEPAGASVAAKPAYAAKKTVRPAGVRPRHRPKT